MSIPHHLRVIGSRRIYQFFLPANGNPFRSTEFLLVEPSRAGEVFADISSEGSLTLVINPFEYFPRDIELLCGPVWLWFLKRVAAEKSEAFVLARRLEKKASEILAPRQSFVRSIDLEEDWTIVVSDSASQDFCEVNGVRSILSPPPVSEHLAHRLVPVQGRKADFVVYSDATEYGSFFLSSIASLVLSGIEGNAGGVDSAVSASHAVVIGEGVVPDFPYEVAVSLVMGHTLLAGPLEPLWGLEPGIDFLQFSTPDELHHLIKMIARVSQGTQLMSTRASLKSSIFHSSKIFTRLLSQDVSLSSRRGLSQ